MTGTPPPAETPESVSAGGGFRRTSCGHCGAQVTEVATDETGRGGPVLVDGRSERGGWRAVRGADGWRLTRAPVPGVRYSEHRCLERAAAELGAALIVVPAQRSTSLGGTSGPCARRCGEIVPRRYGPGAVTTCGACQSNTV